MCRQNLHIYSQHLRINIIFTNKLRTYAFHNVLPSRLLWKRLSVVHKTPCPFKSLDSTAAAATVASLRLLPF